MRGIRFVATAASALAAFLGVPATASAAPTTDVPAAFANPRSGTCLDVPYADFANGVRVQIHECNGTGAQAWKQFARA
ncbi:RICIN domain-containing protein [Streptomyces sp. SM11]|uniref:RICIN domain-containing protein n=1 Tax=Streptomyces sp. SM11 TaxID=565557 RepID=UPI0011B038EC|nr:RICIN domain-containing protein [Streptomyces sp. SM11]